MTQINLQGKQFCVFGLKNSGKTNFTKWMLQRQFPEKHFVFDPMGEYKDKWGYNQYVPDAKRGDSAKQELNLWLDKVVKPNKGMLDCIIVDESNRFVQKGGQLTGGIGEICDFGTSHWNVGAGFIARRPSQVHADMRELSDYLFVHRLTGHNDLELLRKDVSVDLRSAVENLGPYECVVVHPDRSITTMQKPPLMENDKPTS